MGYINILGDNTNIMLQTEQELTRGDLMVLNEALRETMRDYGVMGNTMAMARQAVAKFNNGRSADNRVSVVPMATGVFRVDHFMRLGDDERGF